MKPEQLAALLNWAKNTADDTEIDVPEVALVEALEELQESRTQADRLGVLLGYTPDSAPCLADMVDEVGRRLGDAAAREAKVRRELASLKNQYDLLLADVGSVGEIPDGCSCITGPHRRHSDRCPARGGQ